MTTSGHFANTHGLTSYEPNMTNCQSMVTWAETRTPLWSANWASQRKRTHDFLEDIGGSNMFIVKEQGRHPLNFQQAGFVRAGQEYEQSVRDEVQVLSKNQAGQMWNFSSGCGVE